MASSPEIFEMLGASERGGATIEELIPVEDKSPAAPIRRSPAKRLAKTEATRVAVQSEDVVLPRSPIQIADLRAGESEVGHVDVAPQWEDADLATTIDEMREQWRRRQAWHRAEKALTQQAKALCRRLAEGGDKTDAEKIYKAAYGKGTHPMGEIAFAATFPLVEARNAIAKHRAAVEKRLVVLAKTLPVAGFVEGTRGVGLLSLAAIVGEAGDLGGYANPAKLWKRLGLAVMPDGTRQRLVPGAAAMDHGYSPARRSVVWNVGACIVKAGGPLKAVYDARKVYEVESVETKAHAHNRAQRYVEKRFLRDLWSAWRKGGSDQDRVVLHRN